MLKLSIILLCFSVYTVVSSDQNFHHPINTCHIGDVLQNDCNKCLCTSRAYYECKPVDCNRTRSLNNDVVEFKNFCTPNQLYMQNLITCICNKDGTWPHKSCHQTFLSLPPTSVKKHTCEPNTYVQIDCNICRCGSDGELIPNRCTKNTCDNDTSRRTNMNVDSQKSSIYSNCIPKNWYSLAPCQFCYCVNENKLVCNTGNYYSKKLEIGKYNMEICGEDLIKEALELLPNEAKVLRQADEEQSNMIPTNQHETMTTKSIFNQNNDVVINRDNYQHHGYEKKASNGNDNDNRSGNEDMSVSDEDQDDTESEERKKAVKSPFDSVPIGKHNIKTKTEVDNNDETDSYSKEDDSQSEESKSEKSNEIIVDINRDLSPKENVIVPHSESNFKSNPKSYKKPEPSHTTTKRPTKDVEFADNTLRINVPSVLNKVFEIALRKSMVAINNETKCSPGTTSVRKCNMCFCLKNGKELCTANKC